MKRLFFSAIILLAVIGAEAQTPRINIQEPKLYPEGTAYNSNTNLFFVSSVKTGTIGTVDAQGNYKVFYKDASLKSSYGMKVDTKSNRLWVCIGDANYSDYSDSLTYKKMIRLISFDLASSKKINDIDLSGLFEGKHFGNDLALDDKGNIYVTDSYSPVIYKVDAQGKASLFAQSDLFKGEQVGLNGIVWSPKGYLVVVNDNNGELLKIDINNPKSITKVKVNNFFTGGDGLLWDAENNLILIQNSTNKVYQLTSKDNWMTAEVKASTAMEDRFSYPTTGVIGQGKLYALNAKLNELNDPTKPPSKEFSLQLVQLKPAQ